MKKWIIMGLVAVVVIVGGLTGIGYMQVRGNDSALEEIRDNKEVVVLEVAGMT